MDAPRLKNIIILILAFLDLFLLGVVVRHLWQERYAQRRLEEELRALYVSHEIELAEDLDLTAPPPDTLALARDLTAEAAVAAFLLGEEVPAADQGGGIYSYSGRLGTVRFRSNASFEHTPYLRETDPLALCREFCESFGYTIAEQALEEDGGGFVTVAQIAGGSPIHNASVVFRFSQGRLAGISGDYVSLAGSAPAQRSTVSRVTALVHFLDFYRSYRDQSGVICSAVQSIQPVYELQTTVSPLRLAAKWEIATDTGVYYMDCSDGSVTPA